MVTTKKKYIKNIMTIIKKKLEANLPDSDFEFSMVIETREILEKHVFGRR